MGKMSVAKIIIARRNEKAAHEASQKIKEEPTTKGDLMYDEVLTDPSKLGNSGFTYSHSKLCNVLFAKGLQKRFEKVGSKALSVSLHPGLVQTEFSGNMKPSYINMFMSSVIKPLL